MRGVTYIPHLIAIALLILAAGAFEADTEAGIQAAKAAQVARK